MTQDFDLDRYVRNSKAVDMSGVAWGDIASHPVSGEKARNERMRRIDATIGTLPGFAGATLAENARLRSLERMPPHRTPELASDRAIGRVGVYRERAA